MRRSDVTWHSNVVILGEVRTKREDALAGLREVIERVAYEKRVASA